MSNVSTTGNLAVGGTASITGITTLSSALNTSANIVQSGANSIQAGTAGLISNLLSYTTGAVSLFTSAISSMTLGYSSAPLTIASPTTHTSTLNMGTNTLTSTGTISAATLTSSGSVNCVLVNTTLFYMTNAPMFSAYLSSNQSVFNNNTLTTVICQSTEFNVGSCYNTSTGIFTVPTSYAGYYSFSCQVALANAPSATTAGYCEIIKAGSASSAKAMGYNLLVGTNNEFLVGGNTIFYLAVGDTVNLSALFTSGAGDFLSTVIGSGQSTWFQGFYMHS